MAKYSLKFKRQVAEIYLNSRRGARDIATEFGLDHSMVRQWGKAYKLHGEPGLKRAYEPYSISFKQTVVTKVLSGQLSGREACAIHNIPAHSSVSTWIRLYNEGGIEALQNRPRGRSKMSKQAKPRPVSEKPLEEMSREELLQELEYRRAEVTYLKKLKALVQSKQSATKPKH